MLCLAVETTTSFGSMSLIENSEVTDSISWSKARSHSEVITQNFSTLLKNSNKDKAHIKQIFIDIGPGSFTGNRIGINFSAALSYSLNIPLQTKSSLAILANQTASDTRPIICIQNAFNQKLYYGAYQKNKEGKLSELIAPQIISPSDLNMSEPSLCLGNGFDLYKELMPKKSLTLLERNPDLQDYPESKHLAQLCINQPSEKISWNQLEPLYLKASEAEEKLRRGELKKALSGQYSNN